MQIFIILLNVDRVHLTPHPHPSGPSILLLRTLTLAMQRASHEKSDPGPNSGDLAEKYDSNDGRLLCRRILSKYLPYNLHDYQLDGICPVLDGFDLLATTPTGSGKTGYLIMLMLIVREISSDGKLAIGKRKFPKDPAMIVVCLTKALEDDMVRIPR